MWRWVLCATLALLGVAGSQLVAQVDDDERATISKRARERQSEPKPPPIDGWIIVEVCSVTGKLDHPFSEWAYIRPEAIVAITNPISTPKNCVAITSSGGRRIYIQGSLDGIAALVTERIK